MRLIQVAISLLVAVSPSSAVTRRNGGWGWHSDVLQSSASSLSSLSVFQVGMLFKFLDQWRSIKSNCLDTHNANLWQF